MKKLRQQAEASGGSPYAAVEALRNAQPSVYDRVGRERLRRVSECFYGRVYGSGAPEWFRALFANATRDEAVARQAAFFAQEFGGPRDFEATRGAPMLLGRHGPYAIGAAAARQWLAFMRDALDEAGVHGEARALIDGYLTHMAWYIVHGRELVNGNRQVGYFAKHAEGDA